MTEREHTALLARLGALELRQEAATIGAVLSKLELHDGDVLVVRCGDRTEVPLVRAALMKVVSEEKVSVVFLPSDVELKVVAGMNPYLSAEDKAALKRAFPGGPDE